MCHHHVRCNLSCDLQERAELAQGSGQGLREHTHRVDREQGGHQGQEGQGQEHCVPPKEESSVLRYLRQE